MTFLLSEFSSRNQLPILLNRTCPIGHGVEVGTHRADFAKIIIRQWKHGYLTCVDPWSVPDGYEHQARFLANSQDRNDDYQVAQESLQHFKTRTSMMRMTSDEAANHFTNRSLDFVYIDGDHSYQSVLNDLKLWWPKLKIGGILSGHDLICPGEVGGGWGKDIQQAVADFFRDIDQQIHLIAEENGLPWSFYTFRTE